MRASRSASVYHSRPGVQAQRHGPSRWRLRLARAPPRSSRDVPPNDTAAPATDIRRRFLRAAAVWTNLPPKVWQRTAGARRRRSNRIPSIEVTRSKGTGGRIRAEGTEADRHTVPSAHRSRTWMDADIEHGPGDSLEEMRKAEARRFRKELMPGRTNCPSSSFHPSPASVRTSTVSSKIETL